MPHIKESAFDNRLVTKPQVTMKSVPALVTLLCLASPAIQTLLGASLQQHPGQIKILLLPLVSIRSLGGEGRLNKDYDGAQNDVSYKKEGLNEGKNYGPNQGVIFDEPAGNSFGLQSENGPNKGANGGYVETKNEGNYQSGSFQSSNGGYIAAEGSYKQPPAGRNYNNYGGNRDNSFPGAVVYTNDKRPQSYERPSGEYDGTGYKQPAPVEGYGGNSGQVLAGGYGMVGRGKEYKASSSHTYSGNYNWKGYKKPTGYAQPANQEGYAFNGRENGAVYTLASQSGQGTRSYSTAVGSTVYVDDRKNVGDKSGTISGPGSNYAGLQQGYNNPTGTATNNKKPVIIVTDFNNRPYPRVQGGPSSPTRSGFSAPIESYSSPINGENGRFRGTFQTKISNGYSTATNNPNGYVVLKGPLGYGASKEVTQVNTGSYSGVVGSSINYGGPGNQQQLDFTDGTKKAYASQHSNGASITHFGADKEKVTADAYGQSDIRNTYSKPTETSTYRRPSQSSNNYERSKERTSTYESSSKAGDSKNNESSRTEGLIPIIVIQSFGERKLGDKGSN